METHRQEEDGMMMAEGDGLKERTLNVQVVVAE
jgi:hypothetical protein